MRISQSSGLLIGRKKKCTCGHRTSIQMNKHPDVKACWWAGIPFGSLPYFGSILVAPFSIQNLCTCFEHLPHKRLLQPR
jgi:hypothetical protein